MGVADGPALRPPDEVTSGWDVFDPDEQIEQTGPVTGAAGGGRGSWEADAPEVSPGGGGNAGAGRGAVGSAANGPSAAVPVDPNPDDQTEHTTPIPAAAPENAGQAAAGGWGDDDDLNALLMGDAAAPEALGDDAGIGSSAAAPELAQGVGGGWATELDEFLSGEGLI